MTKEDANQLLDEHKNGIRIHPVVEVTKALWLTGDLKGISNQPKAPDSYGINKGMEAIRLVQSQRT